MNYESGTNKIDEIVEQVDYISFDVDHDANGNMTKNALQGFTSIDYDWRNLPSQTITGSATMQYAYDGDGSRVKKKVNGGSTNYYVRGADGQTLAVYGGSGSVEFFNIVAGGEVIGTWDGTQRRYFLKDHLGSVRTTVDASGNVDGYDDYYPFGLVMPGRSSNTGNPNDNYKYTGHERDDEAGLTLDYMMARNYDPIIGRFLQIDPMSGKFPALSPYNYVANNPIMATDPDGRDFTIGVKRNDEGEIVGLTFTANIYVGDQASYDAASKGAAQWNGKQGAAKLGKLLKRGSNVDIDVSVNVIMSDLPALEAQNDDAGNVFALLSEGDFEATYTRLGGENDPSRVGGTVYKNNYGMVPATRDGKDANLEGRAAHEIGHYFGLKDPSGGQGGSGVMGYPFGTFSKIPSVSARDVSKLGVRWRKPFRRFPGASVVRYKDGKIEKIK